MSDRTMETEEASAVWDGGAVKDTTPPVDVEVWWSATAKVTQERDAALATIERVRALLGDHDGPLWAARGVREADIRAALEPTS